MTSENHETRPLEPHTSGTDDSDFAVQETQPMPSPRNADESSLPAFETCTRYSLGERIGQGGMAFVYAAYDRNLDRTVAVKTLRPEMAADRSVCERFVYEAMLLGDMDHPGMVPIFEIGTHQEAGLFYSMKRIKGHTFRQMLDTREGNRLDRREIAGLLTIFGKVCQTVAYAHSRGIVHRDIKPENIMVDEYGIVLVLDWGLSKKIDEHEESQGITATQTGIIKGTPAYMSPEQAEGRTHEIDFRTDVFSLGIILYEILSGQLPFPGKTRTEVLLQIAHHQPPSPRKKNRRANRVLAAICMKALQKDPAKRYATAREFSADLERYSRGEDTSAYAPKFWERLVSWAERRPAIATALAIFLSLALFGSLGAAANHKYRQEMAERAVTAGTRVADMMIREVNRLDADITALQVQLEDLPPGDSPERRRVQSDLATLRIGRRYHIALVDRLAQVAIARLAGGNIDTIDDMGPQFAQAVRDICFEEIHSAMRIGDYFEASYLVHYCIVSAKRLAWSPEQMSELLALRDTIDGKLRENLPPGAALPDWSRFDYEQVLQPFLDEIGVEGVEGLRQRIQSLYSGGELE